MLLNSRLYTNNELESEVDESETWALEILRNILATRFSIGLEIPKAVKGNNGVAFPVCILITLHVFALLRKDGKTTRIAVNLPVEDKQELGELVGEYFAQGLFLHVKN